jgi:hypothetical protein
LSLELADLIVHLAILAMVSAVFVVLVTRR